MVSNSLIQEYCNDFRAKLNDPDTAKYIGDNYIPIIWFGDVNSYETKSIKVVTVSLNPSDSEFDIVRFPHQKEIRADIEAGRFPAQLATDLNNYFNDKPYMSWFNHYEKIFNALNLTDIGYKAGGAVHIDLYTAIPTSDTWGDIKDTTAKLKFMRLDLTMKLIDELDPDIILVSINEPTFTTIFTGLTPIADNTVPSKRNNRKLKVYDWHGKKVIFGSYMMGVPFQNVRGQFSQDILDAIFDKDL